MISRVSRLALREWMSTGHLGLKEPDLRLLGVGMGVVIQTGLTYHVSVTIDQSLLQNGEPLRIVVLQVLGMYAERQPEAGISVPELHAREAVMLAAADENGLLHAVFLHPGEDLFPVVVELPGTEMAVRVSKYH